MLQAQQHLDQTRDACRSLQMPDIGFDRAQAAGMALEVPRVRLGHGLPAAVGVALVDSPQKALYVVLAFIAIQQIEGHVVTPLLLEKRVDVPPVLTIVGVTAMGATMGIAGMLIAEPLIVVMLIAFKRLYVEDAVGDDLPKEKAE